MKPVPIEPRDPLIHLKHTHGPISKKVMAKNVAFTKNTKVAMPTVVKVTRIPFAPPPYAPHCNSAMTGTYKCPELQYRR